MLAALGGTLGLLVARTGVRMLVALSPANLPRLDAIGLDGPAFLFALAVTTGVGIVVGVAPALTATRAGFRGPDASRITGRGTRAGGALVVVEMALALVLLVSAGLLVRSLDRLFAVNIGFD